MPPSVIAEIVTVVVLPVVLLVIFAATLIYVFMIWRKNNQREASVRFKQNTGNYVYSVRINFMCINEQSTSCIIYSVQPY